jgi:hypothetical protein
MNKQAVFDNKDQFDRITAMVLPAETLYAVYDMKGGGTGFVGITDLRLIFMDESFVRKSKAFVSLPYTKLTAVGVEDSGRTLNPFAAASKLTVVAGHREWEFEFRTTDKARHAYSLIMANLLQTEAGGLD